MRIIICEWIAIINQIKTIRRIQLSVRINCRIILMISEINKSAETEHADKGFLNVEHW